tara:strand:+ start:1761 stop:2054 length:294 start_codon:yes stop_codon:yes gene_type:complete
MIPTLVYKSPGDHFGPEGKTYSYVAVNTQEELDARLAEGWSETLIEAVSPKGPAIPDDNAPPMRVELEEKADQLGLKFDGRTSDNKLSQKIEDALGA